MTCVLGLIVEREEEIRNFVPKIHYGIQGSFLSADNNIAYKGKWQQKKKSGKKSGEEADEDEKYISKEEALEIIERLKDNEASVKKVEVKTKAEQPPLLFNLAELQSEANKKFKIPSRRTLDIARACMRKK
jgi:DNA topoisomerase-3